MIEEVLDGNFKSLKVGYSQHDGREKGAWLSLLKEVDKPFVWVAKSMHASCFSQEDVDWYEMVGFRGKWGEGDRRVQEPVLRCSKDPSAYKWKDSICGGRNYEQ